MNYPTMFIHWCVDPVTGKGQVRRYHKSVCSNCLPVDTRSYSLIIPSDQFEAVKARMENAQFDKKEV